MADVAPPPPPSTTEPERPVSLTTDELAAQLRHILSQTLQVGKAQQQQQQQSHDTAAQPCTNPTLASLLPPRRHTASHPAAQRLTQ
jgi:hypothetical protein